MNYFEKIILPSVELKKQPTYNLTESALILQCSVPTVKRYGKNYKTQTGEIRLKIENDKTISFHSFVDFYAKEHKPNKTG